MAELRKETNSLPQCFSGSPLFSTCMQAVLQTVSKQHVLILIWHSVVVSLGEQLINPKPFLFKTQRPRSFSIPTSCLVLEGRSPDSPLLLDTQVSANLCWWVWCLFVLYLLGLLVAFLIWWFVVFHSVSLLFLWLSKIVLQNWPSISIHFFTVGHFTQLSFTSTCKMAKILYPAKHFTKPHSNQSKWYSPLAPLAPKRHIPSPFPAPSTA